MSNNARWIGTLLLVVLYFWGNGGGLVRTDAPIPVDGLHVLIVEETGDRTPAMSTILNANDWQSLVPVGQWRVFDDDTDLSREQAKWRDAMQRPRTSLPWVIVSNHPKGGYEGPLPNSVEGLTQLVKQWSTP